MSHARRGHSRGRPAACRGGGRQHVEGGQVWLLGGVHLWGAVGFAHGFGPRRRAAYSRPRGRALTALTEVVPHSEARGVPEPHPSGYCLIHRNCADVTVRSATICRHLRASPTRPHMAEKQQSALVSEAFSDVNADYEIGRTLGSGNFGKVVLGVARCPQPQWKLRAGDAVAIKVVKKPSTRCAERVRMLCSEVEILRLMNHPNIVRLFAIYESPSRLYLVMELLSGGELFDRIVGMGKYSEEDARYFTFKLLNAVLYLHDHRICHRDLKPENILLASPNPEAELKITDFGLSKTLSSEPGDALMSTRCGTPGYVAPEVIAQEKTEVRSRRYDSSCDMWSVGVIVYILLSAAPPFYGTTDAEMNRRVKQGSYSFPDKYWSHISTAAKGFISRLLTVDPTKRMSAAEALQHDWIVSIGSYTNDLFALASIEGASVMQARFGDFNHERRVEARSLQGMRELLGLPEDEEALHHFRCSHNGHAGHLVLTPSHMAFLAYDHSTMLSLPVVAIERIRAARGVTGTAASDNSMVLSMSNGATAQFDGLWELDECMQLLQACGRFLKHPIAVVDDVSLQGGPASAGAVDG